MDEGNLKSLIQSRNYCIDRLVEVKAEIATLQGESIELKRALEANVDEAQAGPIRRRRSFLGRRIDELKAERAALTTERQAATTRLASAPHALAQDDR